MMITQGTGRSGGMGAAASPGTMYDAASGTNVPLWCMVWPFADACNPVNTLGVNPLVRAPVAPQTANQLSNPTAWTPDEALAWTQQQSLSAQTAVNADRAANSMTADQAAAANVVSAAAGGGTPMTSTNTTIMWVLGGVAGVLALVLIAKH